MNRLFAIGFLLLLLAGCTASQQVQPTLMPGQALISGQLPSASSIWPDETVYAFLVRFFRSEGREGAYLFTSQDPSVPLDQNGYFSFSAAPGEYLLAFGPEVGRSYFAGENGQLLILTVAAGETLDAGNIHLLR